MMVEFFPDLIRETFGEVDNDIQDIMKICYLSGLRIGLEHENKVLRESGLEVQEDTQQELEKIKQWFDE